ncbi:hypothetical protein PO124_07165 [Bacillus licheniformis]|nr:hypothetical protein [Bacillus licheniformis]
MNKNSLAGLVALPLAGCQTALNDTEHNIYDEDGNTVHVADKNPQYQESSEMTTERQIRICAPSGNTSRKQGRNAGAPNRPGRNGAYYI